VNDKLRIAVIFGGRSGEHEVSLRSARSVLAALDLSRYEIIPVGIRKDGRWFGGPDALSAFLEGKAEILDPVAIVGEPGHRALYRWEPGTELELLQRIDVVFPVTHGTFGEDGTLQGLLEMADVPYVGCGVLASSVAMDKGLFKEVMRYRGIPVAESVILPSSWIETRREEVLARAEAVAPYPLFTKPANLGSSVGISKCRSRSDLYEGLVDAARYDRRVLVERGIEARELEVSVLGNEEPEASVVGEIIPDDEFYSYRAKYISDGSQLLIPASIEPSIAADVQRLAIQAFQAIDGAGMARADFLLERSTGKLYLNELNTIPGFTQISMYPKLWIASGLAYPKLMDRLIELALTRQGQKDRLLREYGGAG
jgi:D-alanine-D-alanine ligase